MPLDAFIDHPDNGLKWLDSIAPFYLGLQVNEEVSDESFTSPP